MRVLLRSAQIRPTVLEALRPLDVFDQWMYTESALSLAVGAVAFDGGVLFFAFGLVFEEGWGYLHGVTDGAAVAVEVVGRPDAVWGRPW